MSWQSLGVGGGLFFLRLWCVTGPLMKLGGRDGDIKCLWQCPQHEGTEVTVGWEERFFIALGLGQGLE